MLIPATQVIALAPTRMAGTGPAIAFNNRMAEATTLRALLVLLVVVDLSELRVHDIFLRAGRTARRSTALTVGAAARLGLFVHGLAELHRCLRQGVGLGLDRLGIAALQRLLEIREGILDGAAFVFADLRAVLGQRLLGCMHHGLGVVFRLDLGLALLVLLGMRLGVLDHALD